MYMILYHITSTAGILYNIDVLYIYYAACVPYISIRIHIMYLKKSTSLDGPKQSWLEFSNRNHWSTFWWFLPPGLLWIWTSIVQQLGSLVRWFAYVLHKTHQKRPLWEEMFHNRRSAKTWIFRVAEIVVECFGEQEIVESLLFCLLAIGCHLHVHVSGPVGCGCGGGRGWSSSIIHARSW